VAFTLLLVASASYKPWQLVQELGLVALLLPREFLKHSASGAAGRKEQGVRKMPPSKAKAAREHGLPALAVDTGDALMLLDLPELVLLAPIQNRVLPWLPEFVLAGAEAYADKVALAEAAPGGLCSCPTPTARWTSHGRHMVSLGVMVQLVAAGGRRGQHRAHA
jgi:hypothetical protein